MATKKKERERERVNTNFNPSMPFTIRKSYQSKEGLVTFLKQLWQRLKENSKIQLPLGYKPNILLSTANGGEFRVHDVVLAGFSENNANWCPMLVENARNSPYFLDLNEKAPHLTIEGIQLVLQFLYEGETSITLSVFPDVLAVAAFFGITDIKQKSGEYLLQLVEENPSYLPTFLEISFSNDLPVNIKEKLLNKIAESFHVLLSENQSELFHLSGDVLQAVLSSNNLNAPNPMELTIFAFIISWLKVNFRESPKYANSLIGACRFNLMTTDEKFQCLDMARKAGLDALVRPKVMEADWQKTCEEYNQQTKCDTMPPNRKHSKPLPFENRAPAKTSAAKSEGDDNAIREVLNGQERSRTSEDENEEEKEERMRKRMKSEKRRSKRRDKQKFIGNEETKSPFATFTSKSRRQVQREREPIVSVEGPGSSTDEDEELVTAEELAPTPPELKFPLKERKRTKKEGHLEGRSVPKEDSEEERRRRRREKKSLKKKMKKLSKKRSKKSERRSKKKKKKSEVKFPSGKDTLTSQQLIPLFASLLNKKGRRLLQNRLMNPEFSDTFRRAIKTCQIKCDQVECNPPVVILDRDLHNTVAPPSHGSGFLYSPESKDYQSYLEVYKKGNVAEYQPNQKIGKKSKVINGGKPLSLVQSVIRRKIDEEGNELTIAYEQKRFINQPEHNSQQFLLNKLSLK